MPSILGSRVIGGVTARKGAWPWQVGIYYNGRFHCGGSLVTPYWFVTAAHCVDRFNSRGFDIVLGKYLYTRYKVSFNASPPKHAISLDLHGL